MDLGSSHHDEWDEIKIEAKGLSSFYIFFFFNTLHQSKGLPSLRHVGVRAATLTMLQWALGEK